MYSIFAAYTLNLDWLAAVFSSPQAEILFTCAQAYQVEGDTLVSTRLSVMNRVVSRDGTGIAYWSSGVGSPLVAVHGVAADHTRWTPLLPYLEPHVTIHAIDRRGRGASGDSADYVLAREYEDVAAVVDAVAKTSGSLVDVYGHSHGGFCAFGAALLTSNISRLVLYEGWPLLDPAIYALPVELERRMDALLADGNRDGVVDVLFREMLQMSDVDTMAFRAAPSWSGRVAAAHTITREFRAETVTRLQPEVAEKIKCPVILVTGEQSSDPAKTGIEYLSKLLPDSRIVTLEGQGHIADVLAPQAFVELLIPQLPFKV